MSSTPSGSPQFPKDLVDWAGHHSGGVKRLFDDNSGRPGKSLLRTNLLAKLESWSQQVAAGAPETPRLLLLVGGPGNGKTEAIESTIKWLDEGLACQGRLIQVLIDAFHPQSGQAVARKVEIDAGKIAGHARPLELSIVQDASATAGSEGKSAPRLLIEELQETLAAQGPVFYLCCVNRGVLDDALISAIESDQEEVRLLLEAITHSVSLTYNAPSCWPLAGFPSVAVWPMDAESLLVPPAQGATPPAEALLNYAVTTGYWPGKGTCPAGNACPFCYSQGQLERTETRSALLDILRWYELASGKRWSFRDLFSLISYLLAGYRPAGQGQLETPCHWAQHLVELDRTLPTITKPRKQALTAIFQLATSSYQHALFHRWEADAAQSIRQGLRDLGVDKEMGVEEVRTLFGLQHFLQDRKTPYLPATIAPLLEGLVEALDPAMASPELEVAISSNKSLPISELDTRFSRSLTGGLEFLRKHHALSQVEFDLLKRLAKADEYLSMPVVRRKRPAAASRLQRVVRDFACRLARRSICTRSAVVADATILKSFHQIVEDIGGSRVFDVARQVKNLLNSRQDFEIPLTTTFGQPLPPMQRQATLIVPIRQVSPLAPTEVGRPRSPICFLRVGTGPSSQPIALTYDLFKAVKELERGLSPASLPRTVVALLDTTKARLSGPIVRDSEILDEARMRIGADGTIVTRAWDGFVSSKEEEGT